MIARAGTRDLAALQALETACFAEAWSEKSLVQLLQNPDYLVLLEREDEVPVGYLIGWQIAGEAELARIGVAPGARGQGRAGRILDAALKIWLASGRGGVWLEVREGNAAARRLYESRGFASVGKRANYYGDGETALVLKLDAARFLEI